MSKLEVQDFLKADRQIIKEGYIRPANLKLIDFKLDNDQEVGKID
jgi:hypothetical protein